VIESFDQEPAARLLLRNLLEYAQGPLFRQPGAVRLAASPDSALPALLERLRAEVPAISASEAPQYRVVIVDGRATYGQAEQQALADYARAGGTLWLHNLKPESAQAWSEALGLDIALRPLGDDYFSGRLSRLPSDPFWTGLSLDDTYWHLRTAYYAGWPPKYRLDHLEEYEIVPTADSISRAAPLVWRRLVCGAGAVVVDQVRWAQGNERVRDLADRLVSLLLTSAGAAFRPAPPQRSLPRGLKYYPIDLVPYLNRSLADEEDNDGQGGWSDQGRRTDLRDFPTGEQSFRGVPFQIVPGENNIVALKGLQRQLGVPKSVEGIALGRTAQALYFLQSGAWINPGLHHASYWINYADGSRYEIKLIGGLNYRDWSDPHPEAPFLGESETKTQVAWTGSNPTFPVTSVYLMEWINPYPEKVIASLDFESMVQAIPILLGLTVADLPSGQARAAAPAGDREKAEVLSAEGEELLAAERYEQALAKFEAAALADPSFLRPLVRMARIHEQLNQWPEAERAYLRALEVNPHSTEACNSLAAKYRQQWELEKALRMYRRSLDINWNQPLAKTALDELERELLRQ